MDTNFIIIVDKDTMVSIIYTKCDDAVVHQIAEIYYGIHSIPNSLVVYYNQVSQYATKVSQGKPVAINNILAFFIYLFLNFS